MFGGSLRLIFSTLLLAVQVQSQTNVTISPENLKLPVCQLLKLSLSALSLVSLPGTSTYDDDIDHWAVSSSQPAKCSIRPGSAKDVGITLAIVGLTRTPFAVKGGGHASNQGFSSTSGVMIAMSKFSDVVYDAASQTATIGAGLIWDQVYAALDPHDVKVVGGRVSGVGVAGLTLGGGYSYLTNQYGLALDTVTAFELVKPTGAVVTVTNASDPDLFFGLKGGFNNFGIVTKFTLRTFPGGQVWGGTLSIAGEPLIDVVSDAIVKWDATVKDPKASIIPAYDYVQGNLTADVLLFYDGPTPPNGLFDDILAIPTVASDLSTRSYLSMVQSSRVNGSIGFRGAFNGIPVRQYTPKFMEAVKNESTFWGQALSQKSAFLLTYAIEPFLPTIFSHATSPSAYPPDRSYGFSPFNIYYAWTSDAFDVEMRDAIRQSAAHLRSVALSDGQDLTGSAIYPNYAIYDTPLSQIYGENLPRLKALKAKVDPLNVMGLAGGFKF